MEKLKYTLIPAVSRWRWATRISFVLGYVGVIGFLGTISPASGVAMGVMGGGTMLMVIQLWHDDWEQAGRVRLKAERAIRDS